MIWFTEWFFLTLLCGAVSAFAAPINDLTWWLIAVPIYAAHLICMMAWRAAGAGRGRKPSPAEKEENVGDEPQSRAEKTP